MKYHSLPRIRTVAVIGGGSAGLSTARQLIQSGLDVLIIEKNGSLGESWTKAVHHEVNPHALPAPSEAAFVPIARGRQGVRTVSEKDETVEEGVKVTLPQQAFATSSIALDEFPFPPTTPQFIPRAAVSAYVRSYASHFDLEPYLQLNTRVELVEKARGAKEQEAWRVRLRHITKSDAGIEETLWDEYFDAVVVATGRQVAPFVPSLPGLGFVPTLAHTHTYSTPTSYSDVAVIIIGSGQSALEMAHKLSPFVRKIWISARKIAGPESHQAWRRLQRFVLPSNAEIVQAVEAFEGEQHVRLVDGRILSGISEVIFATGFQYSLPFFPQYHTDPPPSLLPKTVYPSLVTDGKSILHLHSSTFYIPDPTLAILHASPTFNSAAAEMQAQAITRVWTKSAALPPREEMWPTYGALLERNGEQWVNWKDEAAFVAETENWLDTHAVLAGVEPVISPRALSEKEKAQELFVGRFGITKGQFQDVWEAEERGGGSAREEMERKVRTAMMRRNGVY